MSFAKAQDLLRLAQMAASRRQGVSLDEICSEFGVSHRTAQRMTEALEVTFANVTTTDAEDRRRYWRLAAHPPAALQPRQETRIEALEIAARAARLQTRLRRARALEDVRDGLLAQLTSRDASRSEADAEAVLASLGQVMRPGPTVAFALAKT
jgi:predicted DNA-binding transcriptional regulator YafY